MSDSPPAWLWFAAPPVALTLAAGSSSSERDPERPVLPVSEPVQERYAVDLEEWA